VFWIKSIRDFFNLNLYLGFCQSFELLDDHIGFQFSLCRQRDMLEIASSALPCVPARCTNPIRRWLKDCDRVRSGKVFCQAGHLNYHSFAWNCMSNKNYLSFMSSHAMTAVRDWSDDYFKPLTNFKREFHSELLLIVLAPAAPIAQGGNRLVHPFQDGLRRSQLPRDAGNHYTRREAQPGLKSQC
jgi:hypothetical protein